MFYIISTLQWIVLIILWVVKSSQYLILIGESFVWERIFRLLFSFIWIRMKIKIWFPSYMLFPKLYVNSTYE